MKAHIVWAVAALIALYAFLSYRDRVNVEAGKLEAQIVVLDSTIQYHRSHRDVVHDTVRVRIRETRTLRDTLTLTDTVMVREFVDRCSEALLACESALAVDSSLIAGLTKRVDLGIAQQRNEKKKAFIGKISWAALGFVAGSLAR